MFGIDSSELAVIALVALLVIGPKDLPRALRWVGQYVGKARAMSRHLRSGFDAMMREAELEEMQKIWAAQNEAIMKASALPDGSLPDFAGPVPAADPWAGPAPLAELPAPEMPAPEMPASAQPAPEQPMSGPAPAPARKARKPRAKPVATSAESEGEAA